MLQIGSKISRGIRHYLPWLGLALFVLLMLLDFSLLNWKLPKTFGRYRVEEELPYLIQVLAVLDNLFFYLCVVAVLEEIAKFTVVWYFGYKSKVFKQVYDGVLLRNLS